MTPMPGDDICIEDINTYARVEAVILNKACAYTRAGGKFTFDVGNCYWQGFGKQVPCWVMRSISCDWSGYEQVTELRSETADESGTRAGTVNEG